MQSERIHWVSSLTHGCVVVSEREQHCLRRRATRGGRRAVLLPLADVAGDMVSNKRQKQSWLRAYSQELYTYLSNLLILNHQHEYHFGQFYPYKLDLYLLR